MTRLNARSRSPSEPPVLRRAFRLLFLPAVSSRLNRRRAFFMLSSSLLLFTVLR